VLHDNFQNLLIAFQDYVDHENSIMPPIFFAHFAVKKRKTATFEHFSNPT
jgi:hypothetical protein